MNFNWRNLARGTALVALVLIVYIPAFSAKWIWDDDSYISGNTTLRTAAGLKRIWIEPTASPQYYPLTLTSFWVEEHLFGPSPASFHRDNILIHAASVVLLWIILRSLNVPAAWFIAAVWAIHPVNVESVAWASERKNILSGFFYLLAALAFLPFVLPQNARRVGRYLLTLLLFALALLAKTVTATFPGAMLLLIWWKRGKIARRDWLMMVPFVLIAAPMSWTTSHLEHTHVGAFGPEFEFTVWQRCQIAAHDAWFYAAKDVFPINLSFIYPKWLFTNYSPLWVLALVIVLGLLVAASWKWGRGVMVGPLFFLGTLLPALGFVSVYPMRFSFVADHFQYLASIGMIAAVVSAIRLTGRWTQMSSGRIAACAVLATMGLLAYHRAGIFSDSFSLWSDALAKNPDSWMVRTNLGATLLTRGENEMDHQHAYAAAEDFSGAQLQLKEAARQRPDLTEPWMNLARIEELLHHYGAAENLLRHALEINNLDADAHFHLGAVLVKDGKIDQGIAEYARAIAIDRKHVAAWVNLGVVLNDQGKTHDAAAAFRMALSFDPDSVLARVNLGDADLKLGNRADAIKQFKAALAIEPSFSPAQAGLRKALGRID